MPHIILIILGSKSMDNNSISLKTMTQSFYLNQQLSRVLEEQHNLFRKDSFYRYGNLLHRFAYAIIIDSHLFPCNSQMGHLKTRFQCLYPVTPIFAT
mmetsp:Transcript_38418/g.56106  ORF Transcript_38418/g.56106 Transcript_38418/m.56106 type:complete len:97 (+) Transcript_38418:604-894(+)